jgi:hypothetical protein
MDSEFCFEGVRYVLSPMDDFEKRIKKNFAIGNCKSEKCKCMNQEILSM